jgi:predicted metal-dependent peptidase
MSADAVYNILLQELPPKSQDEAGNESPSGQSGPDKTRQDKNPDGKLLDDHSRWGKSKSGLDESTDTSEEASTWKMRAAQAAQDAQQRGLLPAGMIQIIENILYPKLDWKQALAAFVQPTRSDYTFIPPDRRFDYVFLPEFGSEGWKRSLWPLILPVQSGVSTSSSSRKWSILFTPTRVQGLYCPL